MKQRPRNDDQRSNVAKQLALISEQQSKLSVLPKKVLELSITESIGTVVQLMRRPGRIASTRRPQMD